MQEFRKQWLAGGFLITIMVLSTLGYVLGSSDTNTPPVRYKGFIFKPIQNQWVTTIKEQKKSFYYLPQAVEIQGAEFISAIKNMPVLTISYQPNSTLIETLADAQFRLEQELSSMRIVVIRGIAQSHHTLSYITCQNATQETPVLLLQEGNATEIIQEKNCLIANSITDQDVLRITDRILYSLFEVMP